MKIGASSTAGLGMPRLISSSMRTLRRAIWCYAAPPWTRQSGLYSWVEQLIVDEAHVAGDEPGGVHLQCGGVAAKLCRSRVLQVFQAEPCVIGRGAVAEGSNELGVHVGLADALVRKCFQGGFGSTSDSLAQGGFRGREHDDDSFPRRGISWVDA